MNKERELYWDSLKFVLIFLVIYGHVVGSYCPVGSFNRAIHNLIYSFHMPLFVFVSGRFSQIKDREKYKKGILRIFETYIVFQVIWRILEVATGSEINILLIAKIIAFPYRALWYLASLISWRMIILTIPDKILKVKPLFIFAISLFLCLLWGFIPMGNYFSIQRTMAFMPFFFMGFYSTRFNVKESINKIPAYWALIVITILFFVVLLYLNINLHTILHCSRSYWSDSAFSPQFSFIARCILVVSAILMSIMVMRIVKEWQWMAKWGGQTLFIYIYHLFFILSLRYGLKCGYIPKQDWLFIASPICAIIFTIALIVLSRNKFLNIMLNPISYWTKKK